ncbi:16S rRNA (guanine527-N7)-methyltransferase [Sphingomonas gellani]|uniref:Ribosomal RNA small subunit methyltransferase G n=1 Tax=Sphingomonas gellani TaxID=1166340 RepID=A0A1H8HE13_9SPHN|nr:RsmG family class I SAM-dependent methyltransferase [Sphingomonas gellani]SEN54433.1 16S rRNA (guanine527-N7)-methyltransferase [Sphingomonas gellani]
MTEDQAQSWIEERFGQGVLTQCQRLVRLILEESERQNLISPASREQIWARHVVDSLQLALFSEQSGAWLDVGTGGGFPGMVVALCRSGDRTVLVEPRRKRADFLSDMAGKLGISERVVVHQSRVQVVRTQARFISARAVSDIEALFAMAQHCTIAETRWLLPRGTLTSLEIDDLAARWSFMFHVEQSVSDSRSSIAIFDQVKRK